MPHIFYELSKYQLIYFFKKPNEADTVIIFIL